MWRLTSTTLVTSSVVTVLHNSQQRGARRSTGMANIPHLLPTMHQSTSREGAGPYPTGRTTPTSQRSGNGGPRYTRISSTFV